MRGPQSVPQSKRKAARSKAMWQQTALTRRLGHGLPIVQGPFGSGLSAVELVVAVSGAGGLGSFGVHHLDSAGIAEVARAIRARTQKPFALNLWIPFEDADDPQIDDDAFARAAAALRPYFDELHVPLPQRPARFAPPFAEQMEAVLEARPAVFSCVYGVPSPETIARCRQAGIATAGTATTVDEARALESAGIDLIVASGFEAGGHRVSFLKTAEASLTGTIALIPQVVDAVRVPVIAAGGIADGRGIAAALALGAHGVQIGTAFLACEESAASDVHRSELHSPRALQTVLSKAATGRLARGIESRLLTQERAAIDIAQYPVQAWLTAQLKKAAIEQGRPDLMALWCGQGAGLIRHRRARELIEALERQTTAIYSR